jgi:hypothetical protein
MKVEHSIEENTPFIQQFTFFPLPFVCRLIGVLKPKNDAINNKNTSTTTLSLMSILQ